MTAKAVLLDLENNMPAAQLFRDIVEHYPVLYLFNCQGTFEYSLEDLTEFSSWISSGQIVILETPDTPQKEFEYAVVVGQLMALLNEGAHVEVISAMPDSEMLLAMMQGSNISCSLNSRSLLSRKADGQNISCRVWRKSKRRRICRW